MRRSRLFHHVVALYAQPPALAGQIASRFVKLFATQAQLRALLVTQLDDLAGGPQPLGFADTRLPVRRFAVEVVAPRLRLGAAFARRRQPLEAARRVAAPEVERSQLVIEPFNTRLGQRELLVFLVKLLTQRGGFRGGCLGGALELPSLLETLSRLQDRSDRVCG